MGEIVVSVQRVTDVIGEISAAAAEQSQGINQVNGAVAQLDQMTQQNAALVEVSAAAAESLREQAQRLYGVVGTFQLDVSTGAVLAMATASPVRAKAVSPTPSRSAITPTRIQPVRPAEAAQAVIAQARPASRPAASPPGEDWESF